MTKPIQIAPLCTRKRALAPLAEDCQERTRTGPNSRGELLRMRSEDGWVSAPYTHHRSIDFESARKHVKCTETHQNHQNKADRLLRLRVGFSNLVVQMGGEVSRLHARRVNSQRCPDDLMGYWWQCQEWPTMMITTTPGGSPPRRGQTTRRCTQHGDTMALVYEGLARVWKGLAMSLINSFNSQGPMCPVKQVIHDPVIQNNPMIRINLS